MQLKIPAYCLPILIFFSSFYWHKEHQGFVVEKSSPKLLASLLLVPTITTISLLIDLMRYPLNEPQRKMSWLIFFATASLFRLIYLTLQRDGNPPAKHTAYLLLLLPAVAVTIPFLLLVDIKAWIKDQKNNELNPRFLALTLLTGLSSVCIILYAFILRGW